MAEPSSLSKRLLPEHDLFRKPVSTHSASKTRVNALMASAPSGGGRVPGASRGLLASANARDAASRPALTMPREEHPRRTEFQGIMYLTNTDGNHRLNHPMAATVPLGQQSP